MRLARNPKLVMEDASDGDRRKHGRLRCEQTSCCVGEIVDLSATGMRVQRRGRPIMEVGDELHISVHHDSEDSTVTIPARVVWIQRSGFRKHIYGMAFADLPDDQKQKLGDLARVAADQLVFRCHNN